MTCRTSSRNRSSRSSNDSSHGDGQATRIPCGWRAMVSAAACTLSTIYEARLGRVKSRGLRLGKGERMAVESTRAWLRGPVVAVPTPFTEDFELDLGALKENV